MKAANEQWNDHLIGFRRLREADLPLIHRWMNAEHVRVGWFGEGGYPNEGYSWEATERDYGPDARGEGAIAAYVIDYDGRPIGYVQSFRITDFLDYAGDLADDPDHAARSMSLDVLVGEPSCHGRGLGPLILRAFLDRHVFTDPDLTSVLINPEPTNRPAIRAYEKAGFRHVKTLDATLSRKASYVMRRDRET